jgi:hypothetical protein
MQASRTHQIASGEVLARRVGSGPWRTSIDQPAMIAAAVARERLHLLLAAE